MFGIGRDSGIRCREPGQYLLTKVKTARDRGKTNMGGRPAGSLTRQLGALFDGGTSAGLSDRQLLERFATRRDAVGEAAFAAIVARHGPMVMSVCRRNLPDAHLAEDAFQAVFLVLARRAREVRNPEALEGWLHGVALRTSRCARNRLARRRTEPIDDPARLRDPSPTADESASRREQAEALHTAIDGLPPTFRMPVVLCYLEGLTIHEAAARLECSHGTIRSRIARAREKLRRALTGRIPSMIAAPQAGTIPSALVQTTARAALRFAFDPLHKTPAAAIAREILRMLIVQRLRSACLTVLMLGGVAVGLGPRALDALADPPAPSSRPIPRQPDEPPRPAPGRMFVVGRVVDPDGKPVPRARVMVYASLKWAGRGDRLAPMWPSPIGKAIGDASGRFRIEAPRTSSARQYDFGAVAVAPGFGAGWASLDPDAKEPGAEIRLRAEQPIHGRLLDAQNRPAAGVPIAIDRMGVVPPGGPDQNIEDFVGPYFLPEVGHEPMAWPRCSPTDADGRFTIQGAGRGVRLGLVIDDPRFARMRLVVEARPEAEQSIVLKPARSILGRVTDAETGRPIPRAVVGINIQRENGSSGWISDWDTDAEGRYRARLEPGDLYLVTVFPPEGEPTLFVQKRVVWPKGALEHRLDVELPRGVLVRGRVVEESSGRPIAGARISYLSNPNGDTQTGGWSSRASTAADGSFAFAAIPAAGYLSVLGPGEDYVLRELGQSAAHTGQPGGRRIYAHAFRKLDLKPDDRGREVAEVRIELRSCSPVKGRVVGPDGKPAKDVTLSSRAVLQPSWVSFLFWTGFYRATAHDGHFTIHGLADDAEVPVDFLDTVRDLGATVRLSGKSAADGPVTVRLEPCGSALARLVDADGKPVARSRDGYGSSMTMMVVTPGPDRWSHRKEDQGKLQADMDFLTRIDPAHYPNGLVSDDEGRLHLRRLIPGATYRIYDGTRPQTASPRLRKEFTARAGETIDLGDILIEGPGPGKK